MTILETLADTLRNFTPMLVVGAVVILFFGAMRWLLLRRSLTLSNERRISRQLLLLAISLIGIVAIVMALPVSEATRNQLLTVLGLLGSAIIALSSTTLVANGMAGLMLRATRSFRTGDYIRVDSQFGRVTERGFLHTEIQTEDRELTMLPNLILITNPVTVVRSTGTLVSVSLSLGYDVHHDVAERLLLEAAKRAELEEPFVRLLELGNYSVTYRVSGFLEDIKSLISVRSYLCRMVLDVLHGEGVEIMSPTIMNQRPVPADGRFIPAAPSQAGPKEEQPAPEDLMFDKAERAERIEGLRIKLEEEIAEVKAKLKEAEKDARPALEESLETLQKRLKTIAKVPVSPSVVK